jgi:hypothetical protein
VIVTKSEIYASNWSMLRTFHLMVQSENAHDRCLHLSPDWLVCVSMLLISQHSVSLPLVYILYMLPLICPHCANGPLIRPSLKNFSPNWRNFIILSLFSARFEILFMIGKRFVILLLIGAALSSYS